MLTPLTLFLLGSCPLLARTAAAAASASPPPSSQPSSCWDFHNFTSLVTFGDSYTDDSRWGYIGSHNGSMPPVGFENPGNYHSASGGRPWPQYVKQYTASNSPSNPNGINLYNYAVSGAVCSNTLTPRSVTVPLNKTILYPSVQEYELPAFLTDHLHTTTIDPTSTIYALWIGTNDLGANAFLTDSQVPGKTIVDYTNCVLEIFHQLYYRAGARYFVLMNVAPLQLAPLYSATRESGLVDDGLEREWAGSPENLTRVAGRLGEEVGLVNRIWELEMGGVKKKGEKGRGLEEGKFAVMDIYGLISDIYHNPTSYLNGTTAPLDVQGYNRHCNATGGNCQTSSSPDSFLWFDALHPSEQTDRVIAREFVEVVKGTSRWASYW
ncbi:carbohydrate esterase family 16 protein [Sphaerulina musiva SO2202]|uniref:Carbohydrate esterase family 16 protein n=1 Tax=Sphaerulina musiva (strain SO2202) TaxID=692275 RepID=N1QIA3_SPHMS|nr:carbohydrate esterase family 16 protein [Sphaerulina musiva SO2202]EMF10903.1 carbohydrate esterase family 16 protein [Sphaerulina musiva SO2202]